LDQYWRGIQERGIPVWDHAVTIGGWRAMAVEWIAAAAAAGGTALIGAAATDAWQTARDGAVKLFTRGGRRRAELVRDHLDRDAAVIEAAGPGERDGVRARLLPEWQVRLADLLEEFPVAREELAAWAEQVRAQLPVAQASWVQSITAAAPGATAQGAMFGNVINYNGDVPRPGASTARRGMDSCDQERDDQP
jgi:hypothetical protein